MPPVARPADETIGDRLRRLRTERGLTQEALASGAGVSLDLVKKLERGARQSARISTLTALADALDTSIAALTDRRPRLDGTDRPVLGLRDVLIAPAMLPGIDDQDDAPAVDPDALWSLVQRGWRAYWNGEFMPLAQVLPGLIGEARQAQRDYGRAAVGPLAQGYQLAACLLVHLGHEDLAALSAERGILVARSGDDELQWATLHGTYSWALLMQGRHTAAEQLAITTAAQIEPSMSTARPEHLTVWGGLVLWAMAAAVEAGKSDRAADHISLARSGAARLPGPDRHDYETNFGQTQVAMQACYAHATLGEPGPALAAAADVRREDLRNISYGRHLLDVATAHADVRRYDRATAALREARDLAPVWWRHQPPARTLVADLAERQSRLSPTLRDLLRSLEAH
jgi:transcriptional regulator with XRE-family HTH domain